MKYTEEFLARCDRFKLHDKVMIKRSCDEGHNYIGRIAGIWSGPANPFPFLVEYLNWNDDKVQVWVSPDEMESI